MKDTQTFNETLSASLDEVMDSKTRSQVVDELIQSREARETLGRYSLIGDVIRGEHPSDADHQLASRVRAAIASEPTVLAPKPKTSLAKKIASPVVGFAIAASVALVAVLGVRNMPVDNAAPSATPSLAKAPAIQNDFKLVTAPGNQNSNPRLNRYILNHYEYARSESMKGMLPYVTIVTHPTKK